MFHRDKSSYLMFMCSRERFYNDVDKFKTEVLEVKDAVEMEESWDRGLGLLSASRQLHHETTLLPYKLATFYFGNRSLLVLRKFL